MRKFEARLTFILTLFFFVIALASVLAKSLFQAANQENTIKVTIEIIADSANTILASLTVEPETNARDLMERLFKVDFTDSDKKFIKGIAGFQTRRFTREYWALEVNGEYSEVGIAEIALKENTKIVWRLTSY